ncbi:GGDEF domain-containing protein [Haloimpatiens sp. FM7330]|uniref:GGDEF domain-containing protein n=1 Tax=Haloimpatiens sp. FM7330 TaxID=3298610 RepID=UPI00363020F3
MEKLLQKYSEKTVTLIITGISIVISWIVTLIVVRISINSLYEISLSIATIVPFIVAPIVTYKNIKLYKRIFKAEKIARKLAEIDELTDIYNRRTFMKYAEEQFELAKISKEWITIILFDLDHFKRVNDTYGHLVGDEVLKKVGGILKNSFRENDIYGRFGGEEFIVLLTNVDKENILNISEILRKNMENEIIADGNKVKFTASFGVSVGKVNNKNIDYLINKADECLYRAKGKGRNRVEYDFI